MEVRRKGSRWPSVSALVCLLLLCLAIPLYWQAGDLPAKKPEAVRRTTIAHSSKRAVIEWPTNDEVEGFETANSAPTSNYASKSRADGNDQFSFGPAKPQPTVSYSAQSEPGDSDLFAELMSPSAPTSQTTHEVSTSVPGPYVTALLRRVGYDVSQLSPEQLTSLATRLGYGATQKSSRLHETSSVRPISPNDPLAMRPQYPVQPKQNEPNSFAGPITPTPATSAEKFSTPWSPPTSLINRLEVLADLPYTADWAHETLDELRQLTENDHFSPVEASARLTHLSALATIAVGMASETDDDHLRAELLRAHWGLDRRVQCWSLMREIVVASANSNRFAARVPWGSTSSVESGQGTEPIELSSLSDQLESYERTRTPRIARAIVERQRILAQSADTNEQALADQIEQNYRNANIRVAVTASLLSRYVSQPQPEFSQVNDRIVGTPVHGMSQTVADARVNLAPDAARWNLGLQSNGTVSSDTLADGGSAVLHTLGTTEFSAEKPILVDKDGVQLGSSSVTASNESRLVGVRTQYDWMPMVGEFAREQAIEQYQQKRPRAKAETEYKVACRVQDQMNDRAAEAVERMKQTLHDRLTGPLEDANLKLTPIELTTTNERVVARLRLAGDDQLAAHTPRPRAPADSLASLQIHESAITNATASLDLDGKRYTAPEFQQALREKIARLRQHEAMEVKEDTVFKFADKDAVRIRVADNHLEVILDMAEVTLDKETAHDFRVHAYYKPEINGLEADLVRDGALGIEGKLRTSDRSRMHGVFNKVLSEDRHIPIVRLQDPHDSRLGGLMITQLVLEDGWLGIAVGPETAGRTAELSRMIR
jgi:hypothetical protein